MSYGTVTLYILSPHEMWLPHVILSAFIGYSRSTVLHALIILTHIPSIPRCIWVSLHHVILSRQLIATGNHGSHIIYYHMDAQWSIGLAWTYFTSPDYLAVQERIHAAFLYPDTINRTEVPVYKYTKFMRMQGLHAFGYPLYNTCGCHQLCYCCTALCFNCLSSTIVY